MKSNTLSPLMKSLLNECEEMTADMLYDGDEGYHYWLGENDERIQCGICGHGALRIAKKFGGYVTGYLIDSEDLVMLIGYNCFGHDFAVIGEFIVDWWGWDYKQAIASPVLLITEGIASGKYLPVERWDTYPGFDFRKINESDSICPQAVLNAQ
jgi:hypothetical protein